MYHKVKFSSIIILCLVSMNILGQDKLFCSDYFVFVGEDDLGQVVFTLESTRSRKKAKGKVKTKHELYMYDSNQGEIELEGDGKYKNKAKVIATIPHSESFQFKGNVETRLTIKSKLNDLKLSLKGLKIVEEVLSDSATYTVRTGRVDLTWKGRVLEGFVQHQSLCLNDLQEKDVYAQSKKERLYESLFFNIENKGLLHIFQINNPILKQYMGEVGGLLTISSMYQSLSDVSIKATPVEALPSAWNGTFNIEEIKYNYSIRKEEKATNTKTSHRGKKIALARGTLDMNGQMFQLYGLIEGIYP